MKSQNRKLFCVTAPHKVSNGSLKTHHSTKVNNSDFLERFHCGLCHPRWSARPLKQQKGLWAKETQREREDTFPHKSQLTKSLWPKTLPGAAGHFCTVPKVQRNSHFRVSSHFTEAHKSPAEDAGELSSQRLLLGLKSFLNYSRGKSNKQCSLSLESCSSALSPASPSSTPFC